MVKTQFAARIKIIRTDNGIEFINYQCQNLLETLGIVHQLTCPYRPQNGRVEIKHNYLLQITRAILFQEGMSHKFWEETILHATYIINRFPTPVLNWDIF